MTVSPIKNVILDFDSTIMTLESIEVILEGILIAALDGNEKMAQIKVLTDKGMAGEISFGECLKGQLGIAKPHFRDIERFVEAHCPSSISRDMKELVEECLSKGINVYILSGGFSDVIYPFADYLGIPRENVHAVNVNWNDNGSFDCVCRANKFGDSKLIGARKIANCFKERTLAIGDGFTDYELYQEGIVSDFVAYAEHAERKAVLAVAPKVVRCAKDLRNIIFH